MSYSEILCQICGVSFNVSRYRTDGEPAEAAWRNTGDERRPFVDKCDLMSEADCVMKGCYFLRRRLDDKVGYLGGYLPPDGTEQRWPPPGTTEFPPPGTDLDHAGDHPIALPMASGLATFEEHFCGVPMESGRAVFEHIAGPNCKQTAGYSGARISVEEMELANTYQCFALKPRWWSSAPDDEPFEVTGKFFLTGLSDYMSSMDQDSSIVYPARHGYDMPSTFNSFSAWQGDWGRAMPFHPTCLEVFKRASLNRKGVIDTDGLTSWYRLDEDRGFRQIVRDAAVKRGLDRWWCHHPGDEYLVANPCSIPKLQSIILQAKIGNTSAPTYADDTTTTAVDLTEDSNDVFQKLPYDIKCNIVVHLSFTDLRNLNGMTGAFRGLHQSAYHEMVLREIPWLWEAWSSLPVAPWATTTEKRLKAGEEPRAVPMEPLSLNGGTDWEALGLRVERAGDAVLGLRNRRRIWNDCQQILDKIEGAQ